MKAKLLKQIRKRFEILDYNHSKWREVGGGYPIQVADHKDKIIMYHKSIRAFIIQSVNDNMALEAYSRWLKRDALAPYKNIMQQHIILGRRLGGNRNIELNYEKEER